MKNKLRIKPGSLDATELAQLTSDIAAENRTKGLPVEGADFTESPADRVNPLLTSLPPTLDMRNATVRLTSLPDFDVAERAASTTYRMVKAESLDKIHVPTPTSIRIYQAIDQYIRATYRRTDPNNVVNVQALFALNNGVVRAEDLFPEIDGGSCIVMPGVTGGGKTNLLHAIKRIYPASILHGSDSGIEQRISIPLLYVRTSGEPSFIGLGRDFGNALVTYVGDNSLSTALLNSKRNSLSETCGLIVKACRTYSIGIVVLDEFQDVVGTGNNDALRMSRMLMNQRDNSGVAIVYSGNYGMISSMQTTARFTRRHANGGFSVDRFTQDSPYWQRIVKTFWKCQWVRTPAPLTAQLSDLIYEFTQGVPGYLKSLMQGAHLLSIGAAEIIDAEILEASYTHTMSSNHRYIRALATEDPAIISQYPDIYNPFEGRDAAAELRATIAERKRKQAKREAREKGIRETGYGAKGGIPHG